MKKLLTFLLAAMAFVACTQNEVEELTANREALPETLTVGFEGDDTRVELNDALKTVWTEGDEVSVFYRSYENMRWAFQGATGDRSGELKLVSGEVGEQLMDNTIVVYPYNESYKINLSEGGVEASLPAVQSYKYGSYGKEGNIMVAAGEFTQFTLKSVCGWLRVELTGEGEVVESITVRGNGDEQLAGLCYIDAADASVTLASDESYAEEDGEVSGNLNFDGSMLTEVVLNCGEGVELGAEATEFYVALLPQTFEKGMTVEVDYANGNSQTLVCENNVTIRRNHISPIGIEANEEADVPTNQLWYTATALVEPYKSSAFNVAIVSNEWNEATGEGVITFDGEPTTIGYEAFYDCESLTSVTIGDSVTTIGNSAFYGCESLTSVTIPNSVTAIGYMAFYDCSSLTSVTIPDSVMAIGGFAFCYCGITSVTIPDSVISIGDDVFGGCLSLTEFKGKFAEDGGRCLIKDNTIIAYAEASGTTYTIPDSVTTIGDWVFSGCDNLTSVTIPDSVTTIGDHAFRYCDNLTDVTIPDSVTTIGDEAFYQCSSLTSVTIGESVTTIGNRTFTSCYNLAEFKGKFAADGGRCLIIDGALRAFAIGCGATEYVIPDSVTAIGNYAFDNCRSLTSITIGDSVTTIGDEAFYDCYNLTSVYCKATTPPTLGDDYVFYNNASGRKIYVPAESVEAYKAADGWSEYAADIVGYDFEAGEGDVVKSELFYTATALVEPYDATAFNVAIVSNEWDETTGEGVITFDGELTEIGDEAFRDCSSLTSVTIPDSVTTIGKRAFYSCESLTSVTIGDSVTTIGDQAFSWCESLTSVTIPDSVTTIGNYAFEGCDSLTNVTIGDSVTTIGDQAFSWCESLTSVYITDVAAWCNIAFDSYGSNPLYYANALYLNNELVTELTIPNRVTTIGNYTFSGCTSLTSVTIGDSVMTIGDAAFYECSSLTSVTIPDSVTKIGNEAFASCSSLAEFKGKFAADGGRCLIIDGVLNAFAFGCGVTEYTIPDSVTSIGNSVFYYCDSLTSVTIPDSVTSIGENAFFNCDSLTSVTIPDSVTTIGDDAFRSCDSLISVTIGDSVTTIGWYAFNSCESLTSVTIPDSVTSIGWEAFCQCFSLTSVTIGDSVTTIGYKAFYDCLSLTSVYCKATTPPILLGAVFAYYDYDLSYYVNIGSSIYVPAESVEAYKADSGWSEYAADIVGYDFE